GTDGILKVDNGATVTLNNVQSGVSTTLTSDTGGTVDVFLAGGLRAGTATAKSVGTGDGSMATIINNINNAGFGITATSVQVATNSYKLQLNSNTTGTGSEIDTDSSEFTGIGSMNTLVQGVDAQLTVGTGPGAYKITSASNTVSTLLPGVTLSLQKEDPTTTVQ